MQLLAVIGAIFLFRLLRNWIVRKIRGGGKGLE